MNAWSKQPDPMTQEEHEKILNVIEQAEALERAEQERVGYVNLSKFLISMLSMNVYLAISMK